MDIIEGVVVIDGVPLHPLVVHAVVILAPLGTLMAFGTMSLRAFRERFGLATLLVLTAATGSAFVSSLAGQQLALAIGVGIEHATYGIITPPVMTMATVLYGLWWWASIINRSDSLARWTRRLFASVSSLLLVASLALTVLAGHSGAKLSWDSKVAEIGSSEVDVSQE